MPTDWESTVMPTSAASHSSSTIDAVADAPGGKGLHCRGLLSVRIGGLSSDSAVGSGRLATFGAQPSCRRLLDPPVVRRSIAPAADAGPGSEPRHRAGTRRRCRSAPSAMMAGWSIRDRLVPLDGAFNFRDLGGYPAADGRRHPMGEAVPQRHPPRAHRRDVDRLRSLGLATIVDLRTAARARADRTGAAGPEPDASGICRSIGGRRGGEADGQRPAPAGDDLAERYLWYLDVGAAALVEALTLLAEPANYPAGLPLRGGQGPHRGAGRPGARHPGRGARGHRGRLRDHRRTGWS